MKQLPLLLFFALSFASHAADLDAFLSVQNGKAVLSLQSSNAIGNFRVTGSTVTATNPTPASESTNTALEGWVTNVVAGTALNDASLWVGVTFTNYTERAITNLGRWVISGNSQAHNVALLRLDLYTVQAQVSIATSGQTAGAFAWGSTNTMLVAGIVYALLTQETNGGDQYLGVDTSISVDSSMATLGLPCYWQGAGFEISTYGTQGHSYGPVSFK